MESYIARSFWLVTTRQVLIVILALSMFALSGHARATGESTADDVVIQWRAWEQATFDHAAEVDKPIFLYIGAVWCMNCHIFEERVLGKAGIATLINENYIPVKLDADERPDIAERYVVRGLPTFSFLMPDGKVIVQGNNIPANVFRKNAKLVTSLYDNKRHKILAAISKREAEAAYELATSGSIDDTLIGDIDALLLDDFDAEHGGFGEGAKFPLPYNLEFLLTRYQLTGDKSYLNKVEKTVLGIQRGLLDGIEGGFYRYSTSNDWLNPHYEKMLDVNARIIDVFLETYQLTQNDQIKDAVLTSLAYIERELYDAKSGMYYSSQDAERGEYYQLDEAGRKARTPPKVDTRIFPAGNAHMSLSLIKAYAATQDRTYLKRAIKNIGALQTQFMQHDGLLAHDQSGGGRYLNDQVLTALAAVRLYEFTGEDKHLHFAETLARALERSLWDKEYSGFYSFDPSKALAAHKREFKSKEGNAWAAELYWRLYYLTKNDHYHNMVEKILDAFPETRRGAEYIDDVALPKLAEVLAKYQQHAVEIHVVQGTKQQTSEPLMLEIAKHFGGIRVVEILDPKQDGQRLTQLGYPIKAQNTAYLCVDEVCLPATKEKLAKAIETISEIIQE